MSNTRDDITVRIRADHAEAQKQVQQFVGSAGKAFDTLPKIVQQAAASVDGLTGKIGKMEVELAQLPSVVRQLASSIDTLSGKVDRLGSGSSAASLTRHLRESNQEATKLHRTFEAMQTSGKMAASAIAGYTAGKMVLSPHIDRMVDYDTKLSHLTNVALADKSPAERIAGKTDLNRTVMEAIRAGGGTRDQAVDTLSKIMGSGVVSDQDARTMLPSVMRGATASGAHANEIADIGIRAMQNFGFKAADLPKVLDMAIKSGNMGGFELKDMAKWLPAQMAQASLLGMKGEKGMAQLLALNQASITTAGSTDIAGNNVVNLLNKLNSADTQNDFKKQGINLTGSLQAAVGKGVDPITAFAFLVDKIMAKDKNYQDLDKKRKAATSDSERAEILDKQLQLAEGTAIGKVLQDQQARGAFVGFKKQGAAFYSQVDQTINGKASGTTDGNFAVVASGPGFKQEQSQAEQLNAQNEAMRKLIPALDSYWEGVTKVAREYPVLTTALEGGKIGVSTLAAGAGAASLVMTLLTRNATAAAAALGGVAATGGGKSLTGGPYGAGMGKLGKGLNVIGAGMLGWEVGGLLNDYAINPLANLAGGGKGDTLGTLLYSLTHSDYGASQSKQFQTTGASKEAVEGALNAGLKPQPVKAQIGLTVGFDETGQLAVKKQSVSGENVDLATGPMMMN